MVHHRVAVLVLVASAACGGATAACGGGSPVSPAPTPAPPVPTVPSDTLKSAASARGKLVGTAVQTSLLGRAQYGTIAAREFNYLTAEYEMKWNIVEPSPGTANFGAGDAIVGYA